MKDTRKFFPLFTFYDRTGIENYLEEKAENGWLLEKMTGFGWKFRRIEPKKLHYMVTYFPKVSAFDPSPTDEQQEFTEFCEHHGWVFVTSNAQMQVFYNERENPVPIETDPVIELENIHASAKKSFLPTYYILLFNGVIQLMSFMTKWKNDPVGVLTSNVYLNNLFCFVMIFVLCITEIISYFRWHKKALAAAADGRFTETKSHNSFQLICVGFMMAGLGGAIASVGSGYMLRTVFYTFAGIISSTAVIAMLSGCMKKMNVPGKVNRFVTYAASGILGMAVAVAVIFTVVSGTGNLGHEPVSVYEYGMFDIEVYNDPIPLKLEDMDEKYSEYERFSYELYFNSSVFAENRDCVQEPHISDSDDIPSLRYTVYEIKFSPIYDTLAKMIYDDISDSYNYDGEIIASFEEINPLPFMAEKAYRMYYRENEPMDKYLLFYTRNIVELKADFDLTESQMNVIGLKLGHVYE